MDKTELLKSVLQNFINDKPDEAKADFHQYLTLKSKEITGIGATPAVEQENTEEQNSTPSDQASTDAVEVTPEAVTPVADQTQVA